MHLDTTILSNTLPALAILLIAEMIYMIKEHKHDNKDMFSSFCLTLGAIPISFFTTGTIIFTYSLLYQFRFFSIPSDRWWAWVILFFGDDISYYWYHRMSHQIRFLWHLIWFIIHQKNLHFHQDCVCHGPVILPAHFCFGHGCH